MGSSVFVAGSSAEHDFGSDARPIHRVQVEGFWMDRTEVTNAQFAQFVEATGYITVAEQSPSAQEFSRIPPAKRFAGSTVFAAPSASVPLDDASQWWRYVPGADWRHPNGPNSSIAGREEFPVVQVSFPDAIAYALWAGKRLPTEAEWEFGARGGLAGQPYVWGAKLRPHGKWMANTWQGPFPNKDTGADGFASIAPVAQYPPNGYGLYDVAGNVWEWCSDWYRADYYRQLTTSNAITRDPQGPSDGLDPEEPNVPKRVQRGGSFLCTGQYCARYLVGSRGKGDPNTASNHVGFRCVMTPTLPR